MLLIHLLSESFREFLSQVHLTTISRSAKSQPAIHHFSAQTYKPSFYGFIRSLARRAHGTVPT